MLQYYNTIQPCKILSRRLGGLDTIYNVHCTMYIVHRTLYSAHCTLYSVHCTWKYNYTA